MNHHKRKNERERRMKLAIVGSRTFNDYKKLREVTSTFFRFQDIEAIISGGASGADSLGEKFAEDLGLPLRRHLPDWNKNGKSAGFLRNQNIVDDCDVVLALWDGHSKGTEDTIAKARLARKPTVIIYV